MAKKYTPTVGLRNVGSYQVSGAPYVTSSTIADGSQLKIEFPTVTNNVTIKRNNYSEKLNSLYLSGSTTYVTHPNSTVNSGIEDLWFIRDSLDDTVVGEKSGFTFSLWYKWLATPESSGQAKRDTIIGIDRTTGFTYNILRAAAHADSVGGPNEGRVDTVFHDISSTNEVLTSPKFYLVSGSWAFYTAVITQEVMNLTTGPVHGTSWPAAAPIEMSVASASLQMTVRWYKDGNFIVDAVGASTRGRIDYQGWNLATAEYQGTRGQPFVGGKAVTADGLTRDAIFWNGALTDDQVKNLYEAGNDYASSAFVPTASATLPLVNRAASGYVQDSEIVKFAWMKPTGSAQDPAPAFILNHSSNTPGGIGNQFNYGATPTGVEKIVTDSPFTSTPEATGEVRISMLSPSANPNIADKQHYWKLEGQNDQISMNIKAKEIYLSASGGDCAYGVQADLTGIAASRMFDLTGSGIDS